MDTPLGYLKHLLLEERNTSDATLNNYNSRPLRVRRPEASYGAHASLSHLELYLFTVETEFQPEGRLGCL